MYYVSYTRRNEMVKKKKRYASSLLHINQKNKQQLCIAYDGRKTYLSWTKSHLEYKNGGSDIQGKKQRRADDN